MNVSKALQLLFIMRSIDCWKSSDRGLEKWKKVQRGRSWKIATEKKLIFLVVLNFEMMKGNQQWNTLWTMDTIKSMRNNGFMWITQRFECFVFQIWSITVVVMTVRCQVRSVKGPMMNAIIISNANLFKSQSANLNNRSKMFNLRNNKGDDEHLCPLQTLKTHISHSPRHTFLLLCET